MLGTLMKTYGPDYETLIPRKLKPHTFYMSRLLTTFGLPQASPKPFKKPSHPPPLSNQQPQQASSPPVKSFPRTGGTKVRSWACRRSAVRRF